MNFARPISMLSLALAFAANAADPAPPMAAGDLAARLSAIRQDGASLIRLRLEINGAKKEVLQLQIKQRRAKSGTEAIYQVLWPKERKGEGVLLRQTASRAASGTVFAPPNSVTPIDDLKGALFGSDLSYEDLIVDFFAWGQQAIVGTEEVNGVSCQILESKPGRGERSGYSRVRSWIDTRRLVPLRVEKYTAAGQVARRIDTTKVVSDAGHHIPANLTIRGTRGGSSTDLDGSRIKHDVTFGDGEFTAEALKELTASRGATD